MKVAKVGQKEVRDVLRPLRYSPHVIVHFANQGKRSLTKKIYLMKKIELDRILNFY